MQTMTWTSPDTGVADRPDEAALVQGGLHLNSTVSLCPAAPRARTRGRPWRSPITLRGPLATRGPARFPGLCLWPRASPAGKHHRRSEAYPRYWDGGRDMFQMRYELDASQRYQWSTRRPRPPSCRARLPNAIYTRRCSATRGAAFAAAPAWDWPPFTDMNVIFAAAGPTRRGRRPGGPPAGGASAGLPEQMIPPATEPPGTGRGPLQRAAASRAAAARRHCPARHAERQRGAPTRAPGRPRARPGGLRCGRGAGAPRWPPGRASTHHQAQQARCVYPETGINAPQAGLIVHFPSK